MNDPLLNLDADELSRRYLGAHLSRIDLLIRNQIVFWQASGQDASDSFRGLYVSDVEVQSLMARPVGTHWGYQQTAAWSPNGDFQHAMNLAEEACQEIRTRSQGQELDLRLDVLMARFELDSFDRDALLICLAPWLDLRYEKVFGYLQDDVTKKQPSVNLILDLLAPMGLDRMRELERFSKNGDLRGHDLVQAVLVDKPERTNLLAMRLAVDSAVA